MAIAAWNTEHRSADAPRAILVEALLVAGNAIEDGRPVNAGLDEHGVDAKRPELEAVRVGQRLERELAGTVAAIAGTISRPAPS